VKDYIPFTASILMYLLSPLFVRKVQREIVRIINASEAHMSPGQVKPAHLHDDFIRKYIAFAADATQIVPAVLLTAVGVILRHSGRLVANFGGGPDCCGCSHRHRN
jgi:hypothetical protein